MSKKLEQLQKQVQQEINKNRLGAVKAEVKKMTEELMKAEAVVKGIQQKLEDYLLDNQEVIEAAMQNGGGGQKEDKE